MYKILTVVGSIVVIVLFTLGLSLLLAYPTMLVANWLFTPATLISLFGVAKLTIWQAFWLNWLCSILFKGSSSSSSSNK